MKSTRKGLTEGDQTTVEIIKELRGIEWEMQHKCTKQRRSQGSS